MIRSRTLVLLLLLSVLSGAVPVASASHEDPVRRDEAADDGSTSSDPSASERSADQLTALDAPGAMLTATTTINFSEYSIGTSITNQYVPRGLRFGGSSPFITTDASQPTSPVLSGLPRFQGAIEFSVVNPATGGNTTSDGFTVDVGYIDTPNSTRISYYAVDGSLLGTARASALGINRVQVTTRGVHRVRIEITGTEPAGFSIDNVGINLQTAGIKPGRLVSLGDSYTSGEGLDPEPGVSYYCGTDLHKGYYYENTNAYAGSPECDLTTSDGRLAKDFRKRAWVPYENLCHRSPRAWPVQLANQLGITGSNFTFIACSGALTGNIGYLSTTADNVPQYGTGQGDKYGSPYGVFGGNIQKNDLANVPDGRDLLITIGIGGNDAGFEGILDHCASLGTTCADDTAYKASREADIVNVLYDRLVLTFRGVKNSRPLATVLTYGYPALFDTALESCFSYGFNFVELDEQEIAWMQNTLFPMVNSAIADAAATVGVTFMDISAVTKGHEMCTEGEHVEWINGLQWGDDKKLGTIGNETAHLNQWGHDGVFAYVRDHYLTSDGHLTFSNPTPNASIRQSRSPATVIVGQTVAAAEGACGSACLQPACTTSSCGLSLQLSGYSANTTLTVTVHSDPVVLGTVKTDSTGRWSGVLPVPDSVPDGVHTLEITGTDGAGRQQVGTEFVELTRLPTFTALTPTRLFDTRVGEAQGAVAVTKQRYGGATVLRVKVAGLAGIPPSGVSAVSLNVTAVQPVGPGFVTVYPCGDVPLAANLNYVTGQIVPNAVLAPVSESGEVCFYSLVDTDLVADVNGWYSDVSGFATLEPTRLLDTRAGEAQGAASVTKQRYGGATVLRVQVTGVAGIPSSGVAAVSLNVTAVDPSGPGFVTVYPCGDLPLAANLNYVKGQIVPNAVLAPVSASGEVCFYSLADTDLVADVNGWYFDGGEVTALSPTRLVDTRASEAQGAVSVTKQRYGGATVLRVKVAGVAGIPSSGVSAVSLNVTAVQPVGPGFVTVYPCGDLPLAANLNYVTGQIVPNAVVAPVSASGEVCFYSLVDTDLVADVNGWYG